MANITELQLQGDSTVHKLNDARITTTAVTNNTHILTTNSDVTSIAPITAANLASVLGVPRSDDELLVDLGLPSGNLWATRNVDVTRQNGFAASPYQYECSFFSWGNTEGKNPISNSAFDYNWGSRNEGTYANTPGAALKADVGLSDDFGRFNLGGEWRLPTTEDFAELFNSSYTKYVDANGDEVTGTNKLVTVNGVVGIRLMSLINGKTIFFPCSGNGIGTLWDSRGKNGGYWSSSIYSATHSRFLYIYSSGVNPQNINSRFYGFACRPVASKSYKDVYPTLSGLASAISLQPVLAGGNDNVFIMCHRKQDDYPIMYKPHKWTAQQNAGEVADGVVVVEGGHVLVVAPTESTTKLKWGSADVAGGGVTTSNRETAYSDFAGKANTASQITHAEMSGEGYAPGFCHAYSRVNANGKGLTAGKWWLPSLGEMMMIYANMTKINYALSLIEGATQLVEDAYWTSTEYSAAYAWYLTLYFGGMSFNPKATNTRRVRPVSAFIS